MEETTKRPRRWSTEEPGIDLRDYLAGMAMSSFNADYSDYRDAEGDPNKYQINAAVEVAYWIADAMLEQRKKKPTP